MRVLLTGSRGSIGRVVERGLADLGHAVTGVDIATGAAYQVDCTDPVAVDAVVAEVRPEAVVHLAGNPSESSLPDALASHTLTTAALLDAMVRHDVRRIAYASSNHAVGRTPALDWLEHPVSVTTRPRPDTFYGVAKVAAEALLSLYADRYGIDAVSCRIGSFLDRPASRRNLATWLSHADAVRMFAAAITSPHHGYATLYGISANTRAWWDLEAGRRLGYHPQDNAEAYANEIEAQPESDADRADAAHVGGPYATAQYDRQAFD
jgi:uronate dehydrogenase